MLEDYALASDVGLHFGDVTVGLGKMAANHRNRKITQRVSVPNRSASYCVFQLVTVAPSKTALPDLCLGIVRQWVRVVRGDGSAAGGKEAVMDPGSDDGDRIHPNAS